MNTRNSGGPAFPVTNTSKVGMTLRDYFAAKAMQGVIAGILADGSTFGDGDEVGLSACAYRIADAMLAARGGA